MLGVSVLLTGHPGPLHLTPSLPFTFCILSIATSLLLFVAMSCIPQTLAHFLQARADLVPVVELSALFLNLHFVLFFAFFWALDFYWFICLWSPAVNCLHPATTLEPLESASLFRVLILLFSQGPVRARSLWEASLNCTPYTSVLHHPSPGLVRMGCLTNTKSSQGFFFSPLRTIFLCNYSPSRGLADKNYWKEFKTSTTFSES